MYVCMCVSVYIPLMMFVVNNPDSFHTNSSIQEMNTRNKTHLYRPVANTSSFQKGVSYACIKIFTNLPTNILELKNDKLPFKAVLQNYFNTNSFYSIEDFLYPVKMSSTVILTTLIHFKVIVYILR